MLGQQDVICAAGGPGVHRLETKPGGKKCKGMEGLLEENKEMMEEDAAADVLDAGLIVGCQKVEHYEIAGYGSVVTFCKLLGDEESARLLGKSLDEEKKADEKMTMIAERTINIEAADDNEAPASRSRGTKKKSARRR